MKSAEEILKINTVFDSVGSLSGLREWVNEDKEKIIKAMEEYTDQFRLTEERMREIFPYPKESMWSQDSIIYELKRAGLIKEKENSAVEKFKSLHRKNSYVFIDEVYETGTKAIAELEAEIKKLKGE